MTETKRIGEICMWCGAPSERPVVADGKWLCHSCNEWQEEPQQVIAQAERAGRNAMRKYAAALRKLASS